MSDEQILQALRERIQRDAVEVPPCATAAEVDAFERAAGLSLPLFHRRMLMEVANGGFGPGYGLVGVPPRGHVDTDLGSDLLDAYLIGRSSTHPAECVPRGLLPLCHWGCAVYSYVDCLTELGVVVTDETFEDRTEYTETALSFAEWLSDWANGKDLHAAMHRVNGYRTGINPFTKKPIQIPKHERIGKRLAFADRW
jgi:hypothetical protein